MATYNERIFSRDALLIFLVTLGVCCTQIAWSDVGSGQKMVRVGIYQNAPKIYINKQGQPAGLFVKLIKAIARNNNWHLQFVRCEWQRCLQDLVQNRIDLMPDVAYSAQRDQIFSFHHVPVAHSWSVVLIHEGKRLFSLKDLNNRRIALLAGAVQHGPLAALMQANKLQYTALSYATYAKAFAAVRDGKADAVVSNSFFADRNAEKYHLQETPIIFNPVSLYFAAHKGDPKHLLPAIDRQLRIWRYDEHSIYYQALKAAMVPAQEAVVPPMFHRLLYGAGVLLLLFLSISAILRWQVSRKANQLDDVEHRLDHMLQSSPVVLYQLVMEGSRVTTRWVSDNLERLFGFTPKEFVERDMWFNQLHPADRETVEKNLETLSEYGQIVQEYRILDNHGNIRYVRDEMRLLPGEGGSPGEIVGCWNDLTEARAQAARLSFLTHYDSLTRLPNRTLLLERLSRALQQARNEHQVLALLYIDIDKFKHINESLGHNVGDNVLKLVAQRLGRQIPTSNILARVGGNGFVLLMEDRVTRKEAISRAKKITQSFIRPLQLQDRELTLTVSVGIALYPIDADNPVTLLQNAEAAMYEAKTTGRNSYKFYTPAQSHTVEDRLVLETALRSATVHSELIVHYQPQFRLDTYELIGVEALLRWQHPSLGLVSPARFIPLAEEMGVIDEIGAWVLDEACQQMLRWQKSGIQVPRVAVNLSTQQIDDETLVSQVSRIMSETSLAPGMLELEVTESLIMREPERATAALESFRKMGIQLAIDDFGTGYSSLNYLKHLPLDRLKIDQSFVQDIGSDSSSEVISRAIISLARSLNLETVAEGIETQQQLDFLRNEGCEMGQGYLFSRPIPADEMAAFLNKTCG